MQLKCMDNCSKVENKNHYSLENYKFLKVSSKHIFRIEVKKKVKHIQKKSLKKKLSNIFKKNQQTFFFFLIILNIPPKLSKKSLTKSTIFQKLKNKKLNIFKKYSLKIYKLPKKITHSNNYVYIYFFNRTNFKNIYIKSNIYIFFLIVKKISSN